MQIGNVVHPIEETRCVLTTEKFDPKGQPSDLDGNVVHANVGREMFMDSISGVHILRITPDEAAKFRAADEQVGIGAGNVTGLFIAAPDYTKHGIIPEQKKKRAA